MQLCVFVVSIPDWTFLNLLFSNETWMLLFWVFFVVFFACSFDENFIYAPDGNCLFYFFGLLSLKLCLSDLFFPSLRLIIYLLRWVCCSRIVRGCILGSKWWSHRILKWSLILCFSVWQASWILHKESERARLELLIFISTKLIKRREIKQLWLRLLMKYNFNCTLLLDVLIFFLLGPNTWNLLKNLQKTFGLFPLILTTTIYIYIYNIHFSLLKIEKLFICLKVPRGHFRHIPPFPIMQLQSVKMCHLKTRSLS